MKTFLSFVNKELKHIFRDRRTMIILFGMPLVQMLLFGFAITTDVRNVRTVAVTSSMDKLTQQVIERLDASEYFDIVAQASTAEEAEMLIRNTKADMAVVFSPRFADHRYRGDARIQLIVDGTDPNMATLQTTYASQIVRDGMMAGMPSSANINTPTVSTKLLYNPQMKSAYNFVPGIMGLLLLIICTMMTSVSIVREKERGTMEVLLVSPVRPLMMMVAKAVPYFLLSFLILTCILLIGRFILGVPIMGNVPLIYAVSLLYILLALSLGLLISVIAQTQVVALLASGMVMLIPTLMLSGMIYAVESMPEILQWVSCIVPARWYISAIRKLMIMGVGLEQVAHEVLILTGMTVFFLSVALLKFKKRLE